jgi:hypothetical protein
MMHPHSYIRLRIPPCIFHVNMKIKMGSLRTSGSQSSRYEEFWVLGYNVIKSIESGPMFRKTCFLHFQGKRISRVRKQHETALCILLATCFNAGFLFCLFFDSEDGGYLFLRNIICTA